VRLAIRLVHHIEAQLIAEIEKVRVVGVMRGPDRIYIMLLHQDEIATQTVSVMRFPVAIIVIVPIDTGDHYRSSIHAQLSSSHFNPAETDSLLHRFDNFALGVDEGNHQFVEVRRFGRPRSHGRECDGKLRPRPLPSIGCCQPITRRPRHLGLERAAADFAVSRVAQHGFYPPTRFGGTRIADIH